MLIIQFVFIIFLIIMSIYLLLNKFCDFFMTTTGVYAFLHKTTTMKLIFLS